MTGRHVAKVRTFCRYVLTKVALFFCFSTSVVGFVLFQSHLSLLFGCFLAVAVPKSWLCRQAFARRRRETAVGSCLFAAFFPGSLSARTKKSHSGRSGMKRERSAWSEMVANAQCGVGVSRLREAISQTHVPVFAVGDAHFRFEGAVPCARSCEKTAAGRVVRDADGRA